MKTKLFFIVSFIMAGILNLYAQNNQNRILERVVNFEQMYHKLQNRQANVANIRLDSIISKSYNTSLNAYTFNSSQTFLYDANDNNTMDAYNIWDGNTSSMLQQAKTDYIYDSNGFIVSETYFYYDLTTSSMIPSQQRLFTYSNNQLTEMIIKNYDTTAGSFVNSSKETYTYTQTTDPMPVTVLIENWVNNNWTLNQLGNITYNSNFKFTDLVLQNRDTGTNTWVNNMHFVRTYDSNLRLTQQTNQTWDGVVWVNSVLKVFTYTPVGANTSILKEYKTWDTSSNSWTLTAKSIKLIDNNYQILSDENYYLDVNTNTIIGSMKRTYDYNGNMVTLKYYQWDASNNNWFSDALNKTEYTYDMNYTKNDLILPYIYTANFISNNLFNTGQASYDIFHHQITLQKSFNRATSTDPWLESFKNEYKYTNTTTGITEHNNIEAQVYPVPFDQYLQFKTESKDAYKINIIDSKGRVLYTGKHANNEKIYLNGLSKGVYIYQVITKAGQASGQIIKK